MTHNVPVVQSVFGADSQKPGPTSYTYRDVGTNIDCTATTAASGLYRLELTVADTSVHVDKIGAGPSDSFARNIPSFRSFHSSFSVVLRDGQSSEYTSATDPASGEVMKIDVTLNVMK